MSEFERKIEQLKREKSERLNVLFSTYGDRISAEEKIERYKNGQDANPIMSAHKEAVWVIQEITEYYIKGKMTKAKAAVMIADVIEDRVKEVLQNV